MELEAKGLSGNTILLEGIEAGTTQLIVRLPHLEYNHVNTIERKIAVLQELILRPSVTVMAPDDILTYSVVQLHSGKFQTVTLDRSLYELHIENTSIIEMYPSTDPNTIISKTIGRTRVLLREIPAEGYGLPDPVDSHITATSDVTVSPAVSLSVRVIPHNVLVLGSDFMIRVGLRDSHKRELNIGPYTEVATSLNPESSVNIGFRSENGTVITGIASNISIIDIKAKLVTLAKKQPKTEIRGEGTMTILSALKLVPEKIVIPHFAGMKPSSHRLLVHGGVARDDSSEPPRPAQDYVDLFSSDAGIASVMTDGLLVASKLGSTRILARLKDHKHIEAHARVLVVEPLTLRIARVVTLQSGFKGDATHALHIALWANHPETDVPMPVTTCDSSAMHLTTLEGLEFVKINRESDITPISQACAVILARASSLGTALVEVSLREMSDTVRLWVHAPLKLEWPLTEKIALAVGSSLNIILTGGPLSLSTPYDIVGHSSLKKVVDVQKTSVRPYSLPDARVYNIVCHKKGDALIDFSAVATNNVNSYDKARKSSNLEEETGYGFASKDAYDDLSQGIFDMGIMVHCDDHIDMIQIKIPNLPEKCPQRKHRVYISSEDEANEISFNFSVNGLLLYNVSNDDLEWKISRPIVSFVGNELVKVKYIRKYDPVPVPEYFYQLLKSNKVAKLGLDMSEVVLQAPGTSAGFNVTVVQHLQADKHFVRILPELNRDILVSMIQGGSSHREISRVLASVPWRHEVSDIISVYLSHSGSLSLRALTRTPATVRIDIQDMCIPHYGISVDVYLESVGAVYAVGPSNLAVDSSVQMSVYAVSGRDRSVLPTSLIPPITIVAHSSAPRDLLIKKLKVTHNESIYELHGTHPGVHTLRWTCGGRASQGNRIRVFPRLRLWPRSASVPPRATMRIATLTKPPADIATVSYTSKPDGVVDVLPSGVVNVLTSVISAVTITGTAISNDGEILSQDAVAIKIIPIQGINIQAPTFDIEVGKIAPLWLSGLPNDMDRTQLCTLQESLSFIWNVVDHDPDSQEVSLSHPITGTDLIGTPSSEGCVSRFTASRSGKYTITVNVLSPGSTAWLASAEIWVKPSKWAEPIVLQKGVDLKITSLSRTHSYQKVHYSLLDSSSLKVSDTGVVSDVGSKGSAGVIYIQAPNSDVYYPVEMSTINHIMISVKEHSVQLAAGDRLKLKLTLHDASGRIIANPRRGVVKVSTSRPDITHIHLSDDRSLLTVDILSDGTAVILVESRHADSNALLQDHIRLHSAPQLWLPVGSVLCGSWECEQPQNNKLLRHLGIGLVQVMEHISSGVWIKEVKMKKRIYINTMPVTKVSIVKSTQVVFDGNSITVEIYNQDPVIVPIMLSGYRKNADSQVINTMCNGNNNLTLFEGFITKKMTHPFTCLLEYKQEYSKYRPIVETVGMYDFETGKFACRIQLTSEPPSRKKILGKLIVKPLSNKASVEEAHATLVFTLKHQMDDHCEPSFLLLVFSNLSNIVLVAIVFALLIIFAVKGLIRTSQSVSENGGLSPNTTTDLNLSKISNSSKPGMRSLINSSMSFSDPDSSRPIYGSPTSQPRNRLTHTFF